MDAFSAMGYPHWLIVAGTLLVLLGSIGLAYRQRRRRQVELTEIANENEQARPEFEDNLAQTQANRKAKLAEQTKDRWTKQEPSDDRPQLSDRRPK